MIFYSNPILNVNGHGLERLKAVLSLADRLPAVGYIAEKQRLVFFWYDHEQAVMFPCALTMDRCAEFAHDWLASADYGRQPDHDGDNEKGWRCFTETWGRIQPYGHPAFVAVEPQWIEYRK